MVLRITLILVLLVIGNLLLVMLSKFYLSPDNLHVIEGVSTGVASIVVNDKGELMSTIFYQQVLTKCSCISLR